MTQQNNQVDTVGATAPAKPAKSFSNHIKDLFANQSVKQMFQNALAKNTDTFISSVIDLINTDTKLQKCDPKSVIMECLKAATLHLPLNKALGYAYVIPFNNSVNTHQIDPRTHKEIWKKVMEPTFQLGYKGYIQLALRTGMYRNINSDVVYEGELRSVSKLTGEIDFNGSKSSDTVVGYFAYIELVSGFRKTFYMTVDAMAHHAKRYSKGVKKETTEEDLIALSKLPVQNEGVGWYGNFHAMSTKTVLRLLLSKYGYLSVEMQAAIEHDLQEETVELKPDEYEEIPMAPKMINADVDFHNVSEIQPGTQEAETAENAIPDPGY